MTGVALVIEMLGNHIAQLQQRIAELEAQLLAERERPAAEPQR